MLTNEHKKHLDWSKVNNLMPAIVQDNVSGEVLMLGYMNLEALNETEKTGKVTFFSRTKNRLWTKGETSGNFLNVVSITPDCDNDSLLILATPDGNTCHLDNSSCFASTLSSFSFLYKLEQFLNDRQKANPESSYTAMLYAKGTKRIAQKLGEEAVETALASMTSDKEEVINEASDLIYHLIVLLKDQKLSLNDIITELQKRHNPHD